MGHLLSTSKSKSGTTGTARSYDHLVRILLIGDPGTGKTSLLLRFEDCVSFSLTHLPTIGLDFRNKTVYLDGLRVKVQIWDTAGSHHYRIVSRRSYYRGISGIVVVYSATKESTFDHASYWLDEIKKGAPPGVPVILVGTKCDLVEEKEVEYERAKDIADEMGLPLFETSAKAGTNVELAFVTLIAAVLESG